MIRTICLLVSGLMLLPILSGQTVIPITKETATGQLGIYVRLGDNPNPFRYILDTGSAGFFSARGRTSYWANSLNGTDTGETFSVSYGTGSLAYSGNVVNNRVTLSDVTGSDLLAIPGARMGFITNEPYPDWNSDIDRLPEPIPPERPGTNLFFGTFGAGLYQTAAGGGNMTSVLGQVPLAPGLSRGFVVSTGGSAPGTGTLTIGLTREIIDSFPIRIAMNPSTGTANNDNGTVTTLYPEAQTRASFLIRGEGNYTTTANVIIDTGGLGTHFTSGAEVAIPVDLQQTGPGGGQILKPGLDFAMRVPGLPPAESLDWSINPTGEIVYDNQISVLPGSGKGSLNTGIAFFYQYDVLFDIENGVIGLRPIPEPGTVLLFALGLAVALGLARRWSQSGP